MFADHPHGPNDIVSPQIRNRNPQNLEKMRIGHKPNGYDTERRKRSYWNRLDLASFFYNLQITIISKFAITLSKLWTPGYSHETLNNWLSQLNWKLHVHLFDGFVKISTHVYAFVFYHHKYISLHLMLLAISFK